MLEIISTYLGIVILGIGEVLFAKIVLDKNIQISKIKTIIVFLISTILFLIVPFYLKSTFKTILLFLVHMVEFKIMFNINYTKSIFLTFLYSIVMVITEILALLTITQVTYLFSEPRPVQ